MQIHCEIEAGHTGSESAVGDGLLKQTDSLLFRTAGNAHEEAQDFGHGAESVHVIVIEAEAKISVSEAGVESLGTKEMFASADAKAGGIAIFSAQGVEPCRGSIGHARVKLHFSGFLLLDPCGGQRGCCSRQFKVV